MKTENKTEKAKELTRERIVDLAVESLIECIGSEEADIFAIKEASQEAENLEAFLKAEIARIKADIRDKRAIFADLADERKKKNGRIQAAIKAMQALDITLGKSIKTCKIRAKLTAGLKDYGLSDSSISNTLLAVSLALEFKRPYDIHAKRKDILAEIEKASDTADSTATTPDTANSTATTPAPKGKGKTSNKATTAAPTSAGNTTQDVGDATLNFKTSNASKQTQDDAMRDYTALCDAGATVMELLCLARIILEKHNNK